MAHAAAYSKMKGPLTWRGPGQRPPDRPSHATPTRLPGCGTPAERTGRVLANRCSLVGNWMGETADDAVRAVSFHTPIPAIRVLGVDPGLTRCGLGVVEGVPGRPPRLVAVGVVRTASDDDIATRLLAIEEEIECWLTEHRPDTVAVERVFSQQNVRTVMGTAQAGAVAIVCAARRGLPVV